MAVERVRKLPEPYETLVRQAEASMAEQRKALKIGGVTELSFKKSEPKNNGQAKK